MTQEETRTILNILFVAYPASYKDWSAGQFATATNLWRDMFKNIPYAIVERAIKAEIAANRTNFAPSIGEIMYRVKELVSVYDSDIAWQEVCYIVRTVDFEGIVGALNGLDDISRQIVSARDIQRMKSTAGGLEKERSHFYAMYAKLKDEKEMEAVSTGNLELISSPEKVKALSLVEKPKELEMANGESSTA